MKSINMNFTQLELDTLIVELLMASRLEQMRTRAYLDTFLEIRMAEDQKKEFKPLFKQRLLTNLKSLAETQPTLFSAVVSQLIQEINISDEFNS